MELAEQFQAALVKMDGLKEPETSKEASSRLEMIAEAVELCERLLLYLVTKPNSRDDMLTYMFQYRQLLTLEKRFSRLAMTLPVEPASKEGPKPKWSWKFWR